ncbi:signal peptide peptidase SppA [Sandaracinobacteroides sp. A072]|uniref:signal peptide peptidase SppA n=1 Tax=Sandaracinobacteroides sp. A072 TaxID=3461146 RepID=UPI0040435446
MAFLKSIWTFLVGVKDALVLLFMLMLFAAIWASMSAPSPTRSVASGSALHLELSGVLVDAATPQTPFSLVSGEQIIPEIETHRLVKAIDLAAEDADIAMITLDLDSFLGGGQANLESVGQALGRFRARGKDVEAWATAYTDAGYYIAAHADRIGLSPLGAVILTGPGGSSLYFKDALDKLKVNVEVFRVGTYKSFVEPYTRNEASPEAKSADQMLADDLWAGWRKAVQAQRKDLDIAALVESWPQRIAGANRDQALLAKDAGLVDVVVSRADWHLALQERLGAGDDADMPGDFRRISGRDYLAARAPLRETGPAVAVVHVAGTIVDGEGAPGQAGGDSVATLIEEAIADSDVKALVVRVDSGGGSALASERIRVAMQEARAKKIPVIASFGPVAASGGYWVGAGADMILASPSTITGSIGVFGIVPTFEGSLKELGIHSDGVGTTPFSGQPDLIGGLNEPTRALIQGSVSDIYRRFLGLVSEARGLPLAEVEKLAEGRVWSGTRARQLKLVDGFGDLDAAIAEAARRAGIEGKPRVRKMSQSPTLLMRLLGQLGMSEMPPQDALARAVLARRMNAIAQVEAAVAVAHGPTVQAHCLTCLAHAVPRGTPAGPGDVLARLARLAG